MQTHLRLNDGNKIPILGLGTWKSDKNSVGKAVHFAVMKAGYRHIDCALIYENEKEIGAVFNDIVNESVKREELFITSKLWNTHHSPEHIEKACKKTLVDLRLDYLDLYLMHWGIAFKSGDNLRPVDENGETIVEPISIQETWKAMEALVKKGLVKSIGVANFTAIMLIDLLTYATIKPVMNQIELHPYNTQTALLIFCKEKNITVTAYSPLARYGVKDLQGLKLLDELIVKSIATKYKKTPSQVLLNWGINRGTVVIPKSITPERISENTDIFDFELTAEEQNRIASLNKNYRFVDPIDWWGIPYFA